MIKRIFLISALILFSFAFDLAKAYEGDISEENLKKASQNYHQGVEMYKSKAYDSAISYFNEALKYNPRMTDAYFNIASCYVAQKKYDEAYSAYVKVLAINPKDYDAILQAAKISYNRKNYALAMKYLKYIPDDYAKYGLVKQLYQDSQTQFDAQKGKLERSKQSVANSNKRVIIDKFTYVLYKIAMKGYKILKKIKKG